MKTNCWGLFGFGALLTVSLSFAGDSETVYAPRSLDKVERLKEQISALQAEIRQIEKQSSGSEVLPVPTIESSGFEQAQPLSDVPTPVSPYSDAIPVSGVRSTQPLPSTFTPQTPSPTAASNVHETINYAVFDLRISTEGSLVSIMLEKLASSKQQVDVIIQVLEENHYRVLSSPDVIQALQTIQEIDSKLSAGQMGRPGRIIVAEPPK